MKDTVVISAFPACGKTYAFNNVSKYSKYNMLDSDSSNYSWIKDEAGNNTTERNPDFPNNYIEHIKENIGKVDFIFVSSHKVVRDALRENDIKYVLIYPDVSLKKEWLDRMRFRGNDSSFIEMMDRNFEIFVKECEEEEYPYIYKLGGEHDLNINKDLLTYFKYLKTEKLNIISVLKLSDEVDSDIIDTNKAIIITIPDQPKNYYATSSIISGIKSIKNKFKDSVMLLVVPKSMDITNLPIANVRSIKEKCEEILNNK